MTTRTARRYRDSSRHIAGADAAARSLLPNFLYIGPDKSGSTSLYNYLKWHPDAYVPRVKELYFFDAHYNRGIDWYRSYFVSTQSAHAVGEISHEYLYSPLAARRIGRDLGRSVKLVAILREPLERARSSYLFMRRQGRTKLSFPQALEQIPDLLDRGNYVKYLGPYLHHFEHQNLYLGSFDQLSRQPRVFYEDLSRFLGLPHVDVPEVVLKAQLPASRARFEPAARAARVGAVALRSCRMEPVVAKVKEARFVQEALYRRLEDSEKPQLGELEIAEHLPVLRSQASELDSRFGTSFMELWYGQ